jgi:hypothetical protein
MPAQGWPFWDTESSAGKSFWFFLSQSKHITSSSSVLSEPVLPGGVLDELPMLMSLLFQISDAVASAVGCEYDSMWLATVVLILFKKDIHTIFFVFHSPAQKIEKDDWTSPVGNNGLGTGPPKFALEPSSSVIRLRARECWFP